MSSAAPRTRKRKLCIAAESSFAADPSTDGSGYSYVPAESISDTDGLVVIPTAYSGGRNFPSISERGADGATINFQTPLIGLSSAAGDGVNASSVAADWLHYLLLHAFGATATTAGAGVASSGNTALTVDSGTLTHQDLVPVHLASVPAGNPRTQWAQVLSGSGLGPYTITPQWESNPTASAIVYGGRRYTFTDAGGATLAAVLAKDETIYTYLGGRVTSLKIKADYQARAMLEWAMAFDSKTEDTAGKTALPDAAVVSPAAIQFRKSPVYFNGTRIATKSLELDFGISAGEVPDSIGAHGRGGHELVSVAPTLTVEPLEADAVIQYKRAGTTGPVLVCLGGGVLAGGVLNTCAISFDRASAHEVTDVDDSGQARTRIVFHAEDRFNFGAGVPSRFAQLVRA